VLKDKIEDKGGVKSGLKLVVVVVVVAGMMVVLKLS
jgi:hypothetical protein